MKPIKHQVRERNDLKRKIAGLQGDLRVIECDIACELIKTKRGDLMSINWSRLARAINHGEFDNQ